MGNQEARVWVSAPSRRWCPIRVCQIIDDAIQIHGATGVSQWTPLARMYASQRTLRLADGPDEVHWHVVGRAELNRYANDSAPAIVKTTVAKLGGQFSGPVLIVRSECQRSGPEPWHSVTAALGRDRARVRQDVSGGGEAIDDVDGAVEAGRREALRGGARSDATTTRSPPRLTGPPGRPSRTPSPVSSSTSTPSRSTATVPPGVVGDQPAQRVARAAAPSPGRPTPTARGRARSRPTLDRRVRAGCHPSRGYRPCAGSRRLDGHRHRRPQVDVADEAPDHRHVGRARVAHRDRDRRRRRRSRRPAGAAAT